MSAEKTEQPTAKKLRDARRQGQVVKSKEIVSSALILSLVALLMGFSDYYLEHLGKLLLLPAEYIDLPFRQALETILENLLQELLYLLAPVLLVAALVVVLSHVGQYGFLLSLDSVKPDLKKINPVEGAKKIFLDPEPGGVPQVDPEGRPALPAGLADLAGQPGQPPADSRLRAGLAWHR